MQVFNKIHYMLISASILLFAPNTNVLAADKVLHLNIKEVLDYGLSSGKLDGSVKFYFAGQETPKGLNVLKDGITNKKTNAFGKSDTESCEWVMLSALMALQQGAKKYGADAVVNITSYYNKIEYKSASQYECHAGFTMSGVALKGSYAKLPGG